MRDKEEWNKQIIAAGKVGGKVVRDRAIAKYYENPNHCKKCNKVIEVTDNLQVSAVREKQFCNKSCAAQFNNLGKCRVERSVFNCVDCGVILNTRRSYCDDCLFVLKSTPKGEKHIKDMTKGEVYSKYGSQSGATRIRNECRKVMAKILTFRKCMYCGYSTYTELHHKKAIKDFSDDCLVSEINAIDNIIDLCRNHHWEYVNGLIEII